MDSTKRLAFPTKIPGKSVEHQVPASGPSWTRHTKFPGSAVSLAIRSELPTYSSLSTLSGSVTLCLSLSSWKQLVSSDTTAPSWGPGPGPSSQLESEVWEHHMRLLANGRLSVPEPGPQRAPAPRHPLL